eukprot:558610-Lingulodinium_polyedra.AAC.1
MSCSRVASATSRMFPRGRHATMAVQFPSALEATFRLSPVLLAASRASSLVTCLPGCVRPRTVRVAASMGPVGRPL